jgi:hypothetical protein
MNHSDLGGDAVPTQPPAMSVHLKKFAFPRLTLKSLTLVIALWAVRLGRGAIGDVKPGTTNWTLALCCQMRLVVEDTRDFIA